MREAWTDDRLDDLNDRVGDLARRMDAGFDSLRTEMKAEMGGLRNEMKAELREVNRRLDSLQRTMLQAAIGLAAAFIAGFAALVGLVATQL